MTGAANRRSTVGEWLRNQSVQPPFRETSGCAPKPYPDRSALNLAAVASLYIRLHALQVEHRLPVVFTPPLPAVACRHPVAGQAVGIHQVFDHPRLSCTCWSP